MLTTRPRIKNIAIPILVGSIGLTSMTLIANFLHKGILPLIEVSPHKIVSHTFTMQIMVLPLSFAAVGFMFFYDREKFRKFFRASLVESSGTNNWNFLGPVLAIVITLGNALLMSTAVIADHGVVNRTFMELIPWVVFFSAANAWSEEIFARFVVVAGLDGKINPASICMISGFIFGVPHFFGTPGGFFGVIVTSGLGWVLAKSVVQTKGLGWALVIHFLQDVIIFGAGSMIVAGNS
jgi:membrane protease YdiL (CAAX protease family)